MASSEKTLDISWGTVFKLFLVAILLYVIFLIRDIIIWFVFALVISVLFNPVIDFFKKFKIPRPLATVFVYIIFFGILATLVYLIIPLFIEEIGQFSQLLPQYFEKIAPTLRQFGFDTDIETLFSTLQGYLGKIASNIINVVFAFFGGIFAAVFILSLAIYMSLDEKGVEKAIFIFFPKKMEAYALLIWERSQKKVSGWFFTRILACAFISAASLIVFLVFGTPYPYSLALLAGLLNFIPVVGPLLTGVLLFLIIGLDNFFKAIFVVVAFTLVQQVENNIITPFLSKKIIGMSPVLVLMSLAIGGILWGFLGAILAIPLGGILYEFLKDFLKKKKEAEI